MPTLIVSKQRSRFLCLLVAVSLLLGLMGPAQVVAAREMQAPDASPQATTVTLDGTPDSDTFTSQTVSLSHTTGAGSNRLLLVGISFNCSLSSPLVTINKVTFTPSGESALEMTQAAWKDAGSSRVAAIYYLPPANNPPASTSGTVAVTFNGGTSTACTTGIVVGAANYAGVDQATPLGTAAEQFFNEYPIDKRHCYNHGQRAGV